ncbi:hypothetical protein ACN28S_42890 [Cystobacter fuscus]
MTGICPSPTRCSNNTSAPARAVSHGVTSSARSSRNPSDQTFASRKISPKANLPRSYPANGVSTEVKLPLRYVQSPLSRWKSVRVSTVMSRLRPPPVATTVSRSSEPNAIT